MTWPVTVNNEEAWRDFTAFQLHGADYVQGIQ